MKEGRCSISYLLLLPMQMPTDVEHKVGALISDDVDGITS